MRRPGSPLSPSERRARQTNAVTTGLYVKAENGLRLRSRRVRRLVRRMREVMPWLTDADVATCRSWAELEILGSRVFAELETVGFLTTEGEPRRLLGELRLLRQTQLAFARDLGMTPAARVALKYDPAAHALDLDAYIAARKDTPPVETT